MRRDGDSPWHPEETFKGLIQISLSALRIPIMSNGGALVALLAFLGNYEGTPLSLGCVKAAAVLFIAGLVLGAFSYLTSYLTQLRLYGESALGDENAFRIRHLIYLRITLALQILSILFFGTGALVGVLSLNVG